MSPTYYFKELYRYIKTAKSSVFGSTVVIMIAVLLLGIYITISINSIKLLKLIRDKVEIDAYLVDGFEESKVPSLINSLKTIGGIKSVKYISKDEAAKIFEQDFGKDILEVFDYNPLPASFKISLYDEYKTIDRIEKIKTEISQYKEINDIQYAKNNLEILERNSTSLVFLNLSLLIIITFASVFLVSNTIKLMISAKKNTIELMKLIGASKETIRTPFLLEGFIQGVAGSLLAVLILQLFLNYFYSTYTNNDFNFSIIDSTFLLLMVLFGALLGTFGSVFSIRRFLRFY
ncbi:MAG: permease-like cell division protein FtsX [Ignavibacteria bacterium]|jgi:cell division transport system permease protein